MKILTALLATAVLSTGLAMAASIPDNPRDLRQTLSYAQVVEVLQKIDGKGPVKVAVEGTTGEGRNVYVVHAAHGAAATYKVLFYAQQHGDEVSSKDALIYLLRDIADHPERLPQDVDLWVMPQMNPDGAEAGTRRNGAGADLNRDHILLDQPETQALHRVVQRVRPHVTVDCHEFTRDSADLRARGWEDYADITMDGLDNPLFDPAVIAAAGRWLPRAAAAAAKAGHPFFRYTVGGLPPREEQRHSAPDIDSGLNATGMYGGLAFIIEAAVRRAKDAPPNDLANRVDAYLTLIRLVLEDRSSRDADLALIEAARRRPLPAFLPVHYLWVNPDGRVTPFPMRDRKTGARVDVPTPNLMTTMAVKSSLPTPLGYAIEPRAAATYATVLARHAIPFETLAAPRPVRAEECTLVRVEEAFDDTYSRYGGRQIVRCAEAAPRELPAGSLWVPLTGEAAVRAALVVEPASLYGMYQYARIRELAPPGTKMPVVRVVR